MEKVYANCVYFDLFAIKRRRKRKKHRCGLRRANNTRNTMGNRLARFVRNVCGSKHRENTVFCARSNPQQHIQRQFCNGTKNPKLYGLWRCSCVASPRSLKCRCFAPQQVCESACFDLCDEPSGHAIQKKFKYVACARHVLSNFAEPIFFKRGAHLFRLGLFSQNGWIG